MLNQKKEFLLNPVSRDKHPVSCGNLLGSWDFIKTWHKF